MQKERIFCLKLTFLSPTRKPLITPTINSVRSNKLGLKYPNHKVVKTLSVYFIYPMYWW